MAKLKIKLVLTKIGNTEQFKKYKEVNNSNLVKKEQSLLQISNFYNNNSLDNMELYHYDRKLKEYSVKFYEKTFIEVSLIICSETPSPHFFV